jgi:hypothetical protein
MELSLFRSASVPSGSMPSTSAAYDKNTHYVRLRILWKVAQKMKKCLEFLGRIRIELESVYKFERLTWLELRVYFCFMRL